jgi:hypothetical protein
LTTSSAMLLASTNGPMAFTPPKTEKTTLQITEWLSE